MDNPALQCKPEGLRKRLLRPVAGALVASTLAVTAVGLSSSGAYAAGTYTVNGDGSAVRQQPNTGSGLITRLNTGARVVIDCQVMSQSVTISGFGTSSVWDHLPGYGGFMTDLVMKETPYAQRDPNLPDCNTTPPPPPASSGRPPATARNIGYNPFAARFSNQCTYYAEQRMADQTGMYMPVYGNAYQWADQARAGGWTVGTSPAVNSVVVFPRGAFGSSVGHVAWVVGVSGNSLHIQDYNWNWVGARVTDHWVSGPAGTQFIYSDR